MERLKDFGSLRQTLRIPGLISASLTRSLRSWIFLSCRTCTLRRRRLSVRLCFCPRLVGVKKPAHSLTRSVGSDLLRKSPSRQDKLFPTSTSSSWLPSIGVAEECLRSGLLPKRYSKF